MDILSMEDEASVLLYLYKKTGGRQRSREALYSVTVDVYTNWHGNQLGYRYWASYMESYGNGKEDRVSARPDLGGLLGNQAKHHQGSKMNCTILPTPESWTSRLHMDGVFIIQFTLGRSEWELPSLYQQHLKPFFEYVIPLKALKFCPV